MNEKMVRRVIYTVIIGDYDNLQALPNLNSGMRCICFTDNQNLKSEGWEVVMLPEVDGNNRALVNRRYKFFPHLYFDADQSLYVDGNIAIMSDPSVLFENYLADVDIALPKHSLRNCAYAEITECLAQGLVDSEKANDFITLLDEDIFPRDIGLYENNIIFRNHNSHELRAAMEVWYSIYRDYVCRDQLSLTYCLWKYEIKARTLTEGPRFSHNFFKILPHTHHQKLPPLKRVRHQIRINSKINCSHRILDYIIGGFEKLIIR